MVYVQKYISNYCFLRNQQKTPLTFYSTGPLGQFVFFSFWLFLPPPLSGGSKTFFFGLDNINDSYFVIIYIAKYIYFD